MKEFASYAESAKEAISSSNWSKLGDLMAKNFALRRKIYGDPAVGQNNLRMIQIGAKVGASCKFPG